mmetsp:Transcript_2249/g.6239  ORF Transcript_2249/g.6239 Transcript_2249/m.6239 type:complete len:524 (+) Transcript_2249:530-2101(+)
MNVLGPRRRARDDDRFRVDGSDRPNNTIVVLFHARPGHAVRLVRDLVDNVVFVLVERRHLGPEVDGARVGVSVGVARREDVPVDDAVDAELLRPRDDVLDLLLDRRVRRVAALADVHRRPENSSAPGFDQVFDRLEGVAVGEPVEAVTRHAQELHRGAVFIDELDAVEAELAVLLYEATGVHRRAGLGKVARRTVISVAVVGHGRAAVAPRVAAVLDALFAALGAPVLGARRRRALAAATGALGPEAAVALAARRAVIVVGLGSGRRPGRLRRRGRGLDGRPGRRRRGLVVRHGTIAAPGELLAAVTAVALALGAVVAWRRDPRAPVTRLAVVLAAVGVGVVVFTTGGGRRLGGRAGRGGHLVFDRRARRRLGRGDVALRGPRRRPRRHGRRVAVRRDRDVGAPDEDLVVLVRVPPVRENGVLRGREGLGDLELVAGHEPVVARLLRVDARPVLALGRFLVPAVQELAGIGAGAPVFSVGVADLDLGAVLTGDVVAPQKTALEALLERLEVREARRLVGRRHS